MTDNNKQVSGWDWLVRLVHWSVAILFLTNYFFTKEGRSTLEDIEVGGNQLFPWNGYDIHFNIGWAVLILIGVRLLWGLTLAKGPARLSAFVPTPKKYVEHFRELAHREVPDQVGHNPLGTLAIYAMWIGLAAAVLTGWGMDTDWAWDNDYSDLLMDWHYFFVDAVFYVVCLHVFAVIAMSIWVRRNLIKAMVVGHF